MTRVASVECCVCSPDVLMITPSVGASRRDADPILGDSSLLSCNPAVTGETLLTSRTLPRDFCEF